MYLSKILLLCMALYACHSLPTGAEPKRWVLLVAGSNGWWNYRHQADVSHAYQIVKQSIPEENIIVLMYDDIANSEDNPNPGVIINKPNGPNVYEGIKIDYKGDDVTPTNFINILQGRSDQMSGIGTGRVIESGPNDIVFVNFVDHGGVGLLAFPNEYLYADVLEGALNWMATNNRMKELVFYVEACEAGSMFENLLPDNTKIFVSTASNAEESSWGWYCDNVLDTCLGDLYSINWMEHMDSLIQEGSSTETLETQYEIVKNLTTQSHVSLYGDMSVGSETVGTVFGLTERQSRLFVPSIDRHLQNGVSSRDAPLHIVRKKAEKASTITEQILHHKTLMEMERKRKFADDTVSEILHQVFAGEKSLVKEIEKSRYQLKKEDYPCYRHIIEKFNELCFNTFDNTYLIGNFYKFANVCGSSVSMETVELAMSVTCGESHKRASNIV